MGTLCAARRQPLVEAVALVRVLVVLREVAAPRGVVRTQTAVIYGGLDVDVGDVLLEALGMSRLETASVLPAHVLAIKDGRRAVAGVSVPLRFGGQFQAAVRADKRPKMVHRSPAVACKTYPLARSGVLPFIVKRMSSQGWAPTFYTRRTTADEPLTEVPARDR